MKKIFTLLLAVAASVGTMFAWDYERVQIGDLYYNLDATNQTAEVTSQNSSYPRWSTTITTAIIPASVEYNSVSYSVTSIGEYAFSECTGLTSVIWNAKNCADFVSNNTFYDSRSQITSFTFGNEVEHIPAYLCNGMSNLTSIEIPNSVTSIGSSAFSGCSGLTSVNITDIAAWCNIAFSSYSSNPLYYAKHLYVNNVEVTNLVIPEGVTSIGYEAFFGCTGLNAVTIPNSVTSIGSYAFQYCSGLTSVTIGNSVTSIGYAAFSGCSSLTSVNITDIAAWCNIAFSSYSSNPLYYAKHLYVNNVEVTNLVIPEGVTSIGEYAFVECTGLTSVTIPNSVTSIGSSAFSFCSGLTSVTIPNSVTSIGEYAFSECTGLTSVTIPNSVTSIGRYAFYECTGLTSVTIEAEIPPTLGHYVFDGDEYIPLTYPIYVPCNAVNAYKTAWSDYADRIVANCPSFTISFVNWDGSNLQTLSVAEGEMPQYTGSTPARPDDEEYTYTFSGWTPAIVAATEDATYTATFTATPKGQGIDDVQSDQVQSTKVLRNGMLFIERGEKVYTLQGQEAQ